jgi:hypothetical protein
MPSLVSLKPNPQRQQILSFLISLQVYKDASWIRMLSGYPRPETGPEGEHLLAIRAYLPSDYLFIVLMMEPGYLDSVHEVDEVRAMHNGMNYEDYMDFNSSAASPVQLSVILLTFLSLLILATHS